MFTCEYVVTLCVVMYVYMSKCVVVSMYVHVHVLFCPLVLFFMRLSLCTRGVCLSRCVLCKEPTQLFPKNEEVLLLRKGYKAVGPESLVDSSRRKFTPIGV